MVNHILVVCVGNICRSPVLEALLQQQLPSKRVVSAGLGALVGKPVDSTMTVVMERHGLSKADHSAQQLDRQLLSEADLVLVMEQGHLRAIRDKHPALSGKTMLATQWIGGGDIADPYLKSEAVFEDCFSQLKECADSWSVRLRAEQPA